MYTLPKKFCPMVWHARSLLVVRRCWVNCRLSRCERRWLQLPATELLPRFYRAPTFYQPLPAKTALQRSKADQRCRRKGKKERLLLQSSLWHNITVHQNRSPENGSRCCRRNKTKGQFDTSNIETVPLLIISSTFHHSTTPVSFHYKGSAKPPSFRGHAAVDQITPRKESHGNAYDALRANLK